MSAGFLQIAMGLKKEVLFNDVIGRLEKATGSKGIDTRLIADVITGVNKAIARLGLDSQDTTAEELYEALIAASQSSQHKTFFSDTDWLIFKKDKYLISFNIIDAIYNSRQKLRMGKATANAARRQLGYELSRRYIAAAGANKDLVANIIQVTKWLPSYDSVIMELKLNKD